MADKNPKLGWDRAYRLFKRKPEVLRRKAKEARSRPSTLRRPNRGN